MIQRDNQITSVSSSPFRYSPRLRTALVLTGTGTAGAYHAGVLHAVQEAGVRIDIVAGRGIGIVSSMFAAIADGQELWKPKGIWCSARAERLYRWRATLRVAAWTLGIAIFALFLPLGVLIGAVFAYPLAMLLSFIGLDVGVLVASKYSILVDYLFQPTALPLYIPRFVTVAVFILLGVLVVSACGSALQARLQRRSRGAFWWKLLGAPLDVSVAVECFTSGLWQIMHGASNIAKPSASDLAERYSALLADNVGQPGFRELLVLVHDIDSRRDLVCALLSERYRRDFFLGRLGSEGEQRNLETLDLSGAEGQHAMDALAAGLSLPIATEPHLVDFSPDSCWRGETHRLCDRPDSTARLLEEVANAGAEQVILVSVLAESPGPHALGSSRRDARGRLSEQLATLETASIRDAVTARSGLFQAIFQIKPSHNPLGLFDFEGSYDESSDRQQSLAELVDRGYQDGLRQFVDSVVGASGEWIESSQSKENATNPDI